MVQKDQRQRKYEVSGYQIKSSKQDVGQITEGILGEPNEDYEQGVLH